MSIPHRQGTTDLADNYVSEKSSEVLGDDLYEKTCQFLIGKVQHVGSHIYEISLYLKVSIPNRQGTTKIWNVSVLRTGCVNS